MLKQVISLSCPLSDRFYTKSVEYRLTYQDRYSCKRQEAKGRINNQFLITWFSITHRIYPLLSVVRVSMVDP